MNSIEQKSSFKTALSRLDRLVKQLEARLQKTEHGSTEAKKLREELQKIKAEE